MFGFDDVAISAAVPSFFSGLNPTGLVSAGASLLGGIFGNNASQQSAQSAQNYSAEQYASRYQTTVKDMMAAGLSPMLAYSQGPGSAPSGTAFTAQNPAGGMGAAYQQGTSASNDYYKLPSQTDLLDSQKAVADASVEKIKKETSNLATDNDRMLATIQLLAEQAKQSGGQQDVLRATVLKLKAETTLLNQDVMAQLQAGNLGKVFGQYKPLIETILSILRGRR